MRAAGTFEVKLSLLDSAEPIIGRMQLDKVFSGELDGVSRGEMLGIMDQGVGSGSYVALERITGALNGRTGSFALVHRGTMNRGVPTLTVEVVPDSGTAGLSGLTGSMQIIIEAGKHSYVLDYELP
ncbi:MAG: DUF3224 domain-containing protein [Pseudomonadota bacterium]